MIPERIEREQLIEEMKLSRYVSIIYRHSRIYMDHELADHDFGSGQHGYLFYLYDHPGATQDQISREFEIDKATTARALQKLEHGGFIVRESDPNDRRVNHVFLTEKGIKIQQKLKSITGQWSNILLESFDENDIQQLHRYLHRLATNCKDFKHKKEGT